MAPCNLFARITQKSVYNDDARIAILGILKETRKEGGCVHSTLLKKPEGSVVCTSMWNGSRKAKADLTLRHGKPYTKRVFESDQQWLAKPIDITRMHRVD